MAHVGSVKYPWDIAVLAAVVRARRRTVRIPDALVAATGDALDADVILMTDRPLFDITTAKKAARHGPRSPRVSSCREAAGSKGRAAPGLPVTREKRPGAGGPGRGCGAGETASGWLPGRSPIPRGNPLTHRG